MPAKKRQPARQQQTALVTHYRAIGPAAIVAALICAQKKSVKKIAVAKAA